MTELQAIAARVRRLLLRFRRPLSAGLAGLAVLAVVQVVAPSPPPTRLVVVAAHDLDAGQRLSQPDVAVIPMPPDLAPAGAETATADLVGRVVAGPMRQGEVVTDRRLLGRSLVAGFPRGTVACPVRLHDAAAVGLLHVGERIDVYVARDGTGYADRVVGGVPVIALPPPGSLDQEGGLVVVAVRPLQAAALAEAAALAPLSFALLR